jgi:hypothetical protein
MDSGMHLLNAVLADVFQQAKTPTKKLSTTSFSNVSTKDFGSGPSGNKKGRKFMAMASTAAGIIKKHLPYKYGGGHGSFVDDGYDCSGLVSAVLHAGGLLSSPISTDGLKSYGEQGPGQFVTIGVRGSSGRNAHTMMKLGGAYIESGGRGGGGGPHFDSGWDGNFPIKRHPKGFRSGGVVGRLTGLPIDTLQAILTRHPEKVGWGMRRGGRIRRFVGGGPVASGGHLQSSGGPQTGAMYDIGRQVVRHRPTRHRSAGSTRSSSSSILRNLAADISTAGNYTIGQLERYEKGIRTEIRTLARGGLSPKERAAVARLRGALAALEGEIGGRVGRAVAYLDRLRAQVDHDRTLFLDQRQRFEGVDPSSSQGLSETVNFDAYQRQQLQKQQGQLRAQLAIAQRHGDKSAAKDIQDRLNQIADDIQETAVQLVEAQRDLIRQQAQDVVDAATHGTTMAQGSESALEALQRLQGPNYADTPQAMRARAAQDSQAIVPALQNQLAALNSQLGAATSTGADQNTVNGILEAIQSTQTDIMNAMADSADLIRQAAEKTAQIAVDSSNFHESVDEAGYQGLQLRQQLAKTQDSYAAAQERADYINTTLIPDMQAQQAALYANYQTLLAQEGPDADATRQALLDYLQKGNDISQEQLDAEQQTADATQKMADQMADYKGSLAFEFGGQTFSDLLTVGVGA